MKDRLSQQDITDYALNELSSRERLYVESMMLGSEELKEDACAVIEMAKLLEEGFEAEMAWKELSLGDERRSQVLSQLPASAWRGIGKAAAAVAALAACVAFSVAAPVVWSLAMRSDGVLSVAGTQKSSVESGVAALPGQPSESVFSFQVSPTDESAVAPALLPTGNVGFMEMPRPSLPVDLN
ncbi:MAG: hypothetical protein WCO60_01660 [Verrucomicrobiota bacterium]